MMPAFIPGPGRCRLIVLSAMQRCVSGMINHLRMLQCAQITSCSIIQSVLLRNGLALLSWSPCWPAQLLRSFCFPLTGLRRPGSDTIGLSGCFPLQDLPWDGFGAARQVFWFVDGKFYLHNSLHINILYIYTVHLLNLIFKWLIALFAKAMPLYTLNFSEYSEFTKSVIQGLKGTKTRSDLDLYGYLSAWTGVWFSHALWRIIQVSESLQLHCKW